jgi:hypothetical protein
MPAGYIEFSNQVVTSGNLKAKPVVMPLSKKPVFSNNSLVFYKAGNFGSNGISGVRNSRAVSRRT